MIKKNKFYVYNSENYAFKHFGLDIERYSLKYVFLHILMNIHLMIGKREQ